MIQYYMLTDPLRQGQIIRQEGRKHFRFSFGPFRWERTTVFQVYLTEGTPLTGQYRPIGEAETQKLLMERGKEIASVLKKAEALAREAHANQVSREGNAYLEHIQRVVDSLEDWEEKSVAWLHEICNYGGWSMEQLQEAGISGSVCRSVGLLTLTGRVSYRDYLTGLRNDRMARRVKIADLAQYIEAADDKRLTAREAQWISKCREARQYLFGDVRDYVDDMDIASMERPETQMLPAEKIYQKIYPIALGGRKIPHGVSNPVLRRWNDETVLAFFVYTYTRTQLQQGEIGRPVSWILADLSTGALIREVPCTQEDFSSAGKDERFSTRRTDPPVDGNPLADAYAMLDEVRRKYRQDGLVDQQLYEKYLSRMLQAVPPSYHRFYRELSNP